MHEQECIHREKMLALREKLLKIEQDWENGMQGVTIEELDAMLEECIKKAQTK